MTDLEPKILAELFADDYEPVAAKTLAARVGVTKETYPDFRRALQRLLAAGQAKLGRNAAVAPGVPEEIVTGSFKRRNNGDGSFIYADERGEDQMLELAPADCLDAVSGDRVRVRLHRASRTSPVQRAEIVSVAKRAKRQFVGTYREQGGWGLVHIENGAFARDIRVGDAGAKGAYPDDQVVVEVLKFPTIDDAGEGVLLEVLGRMDEPGVDAKAVIHSLGIPEHFPPEALDEARLAVEKFRESDLDGRVSFLDELTITVDPADARDFDDAVWLERDAKGHWCLHVHIADVGHFVPPGSALDRAARDRGTSVYLPGRVIPMLPEAISNHLASLQEGRVRYVKSAMISLDPEGRVTQTKFVNAAIRVKKRFAYEQVGEVFAHPEGDFARGLDPNILAMLSRMKELTNVLRANRRRRGMLEMTMPEPQLRYDAKGRVAGATLADNDLSHQMIEELMLAANEAVAVHFNDLGQRFMRRVHPEPDPFKLKMFGKFARKLGYEVGGGRDRFALQRVLNESADKPERYAVHFALLRSLKQAVYSAFQEDHYALASPHYCHFTSPIRRYPDLTVHRQLDRWIRGKRVKIDEDELEKLAEHCTMTEKRAEQAERELTKLRLLAFLQQRIGYELDAVISKVDTYGFFAQGVEFPAEGLVHVRTLADDYYSLGDDGMSLEGGRLGRSFRLGDSVRVRVSRVDLLGRKLDFEVVAVSTMGASKAARRPAVKGPQSKKVKPHRKKPRMR